MIKSGPKKKKKKKKLKGCWVTNVLIRAAFSLMYLRSVVLFYWSESQRRWQTDNVVQFFVLFVLVFVFFCAWTKNNKTQKKAQKTFIIHVQFMTIASRRCALDLRQRMQIHFILTQQQKQTKKKCFFSSV